MSESNSKNNNRSNKPEIQRYSVARGKYSSRLNNDRPTSSSSSGRFIFPKKISQNICLFKEIQNLKNNIIIMIHPIMIMIIIIIPKEHNEKHLKQK